MFASSSNRRILHIIAASFIFAALSTFLASGLPIPAEKQLQEGRKDAASESFLKLLMRPINNDRTQSAKEPITTQSESTLALLPSTRHVRDATPYYTPETGFNHFQNDGDTLRKSSDAPVFNQTLVSVISLRVSSSVAHAIHPPMNGNVNLPHYPSLIAAAKKNELSMQEAEEAAEESVKVAMETYVPQKAPFSQDHLPYSSNQDTHSYDDGSAASSYQYFKSDPTRPAYRPVSSSPRTPTVYAQPEQNYEVDERVSVETNGRAHGVQPPYRHDQHIDIYKAPSRADKDQKVGYVVEGRNYRKYRVEERTPDGFIVGEYGVMDHDDGSLRGVRYTADGTINPKLIHNALMKFLSL